MTPPDHTGAGDPEPTTAAAYTATYEVSGMTCAHCVAAVTEEITRLDGVTGVAIVLVAGGDSRVSVTATAPPTESAVRAAVQEAGYELAGAGR